jgi:hypothetical protein
MPLWLLRAAAAFGFRRGKAGKMLAETQDNEEIVARVAALDIGRAELVCCVRVPREDRPGRLQEAGDVLHDDPVAAGHGRPVALPGGDTGGDGSNAGLPEAGVLPAGGGRVRGVAGQRQGRQAPAGPSRDRL